MAAKRTLYEILGVPRDATSTDIDAAYRKRMAQLEQAAPPDPSATALAHEAFEVLIDPRRRSAYDASLVAAAERAAAAQQAEPDLVAEPVRRSPAIPAVLAAITALALAVLYFALRPDRLPDPQSRPGGERAAEAPAPAAEAPKPAPPPAQPRTRTAAEILKDAVSSAARLMSYEMSGRSMPIGIALTVEPGVMITTCHGIPAGGKLVVQAGAETLPADLAITDEQLDLCRLSVAGLEARALPLAPEEAKAGERIFALGINSAGQFALTEGTVKQARKAPTGDVLELSMPIAPTGSGGAIFDAYGRLVGIATTSPTHGAGGNVALPASAIAQMRSRGAAK